MLNNKSQPSRCKLIFPWQVWCLWAWAWISGSLDSDTQADAKNLLSWYNIEFVMLQANACYGGTVTHQIIIEYNIPTIQKQIKFVLATGPVQSMLFKTSFKR